MVDPKPKKRKYIAGYYDDKNKSPLDEPTTEEQGRTLGEDPAKTRRRMQAQEAGEETYEWKGRKEYAGRYDRSEGVEPSPKVIPSPDPKVTGGLVVKTWPKPTVDTPPARKDYGKASGKTHKRLPPTVKWLRGKDRGRGLQKRTREASAHGSSRPAAY
jgi:hypothetical protein